MNVVGNKIDMKTLNEIINEIDKIDPFTSIRLMKNNKFYQKICAELYDTDYENFLRFTNGHDIYTTNPTVNYLLNQFCLTQERLIRHEYKEKNEKI